MLTMEQIHHIKYLFKYKGKSLRRISSETGHHFNTVKKYVKKDNFNLKLTPGKSKPRKLSPYVELIDSWLEADLKAKPKQRHTAQRIYNLLTKQFPEFNVSDRSVRAYVSKRKKEIGLTTEGYLPLDHPPGEAQLDFGSAQFIEKGVMYDGHYLNLSFPYSNGGYLQLFKAENQECLLKGLKNIFEYIGKIPSHIWFDNMSTVVKNIRKYGKRDITEGFARFMLHYGFDSNYCNPDSGHEKGHVEGKVGYHRRNFLVPIPEFEDLQTFNKQLLLMCDEDMNRQHYKKRNLICALFTKDKAAMNDLPEVPFEVFRLEPVKADKYGKVRFENKLYSASPDYAVKELWLKVGAYSVEIMGQKYQTIVEHPRLYGEQIESMIWGPYLKLMAKRPTALKYTGFFKELPSTIQDYFDKCDYLEKKKSLKLFVSMLQTHDMAAVEKAFTESLRRELIDADSLLAIYNHLNSNLPEDNFINLPHNLPEVQKYSTNIEAYDLLLKGGQ
ncbi:IS21 family transposase [Desulfitobacterium sp. AusDCA]|uniref:IS21 family transposase n=1 Tax=Desulfitobacterium sp. AusDCA TaxID=3240383 RepID=UPI003DA7906E